MSLGVSRRGFFSLGATHLAFTAFAVKSAMGAASGGNLQPWRVYVVTGDSRDEICTAAQQLFDKGMLDGQSELVHVTEQGPSQSDLVQAP